MRQKTRMAEFNLLTSALGEMDTSSMALSDVMDAISGHGLVWLNLERPNKDVRSFLTETLEFDELAIEDVFGEATTASLKFERHRFFVVQARADDMRLDTEAVSIFVNEKMLVTVAQDRVPAFTTFKRRFLAADSKDVALGIDYMLYELLDAIADDWTPRISTFSNTLDTLEFQVFDPTTRYDNLLEGLHELKRKLREATKSIESLHTITMRMLQPGERLINDNVKGYFTDLHQLTTALVKRVSNYSAGATSTRDTYLSSISLQLSQSNAKLTEVMTTLTMVGAIMLPLTLIAGIFGMNNEDLPSDVFGGFWGIMAMMAAFAIMMLGYFWRKGWLGPSRPS